MTDSATYANGTQPSIGIPNVIVNGTVVVDQSQPLGDVFPGQPIRFDPSESKFEPLDENAWKQAYYTVPQDFGGGVPGSQPVYDKRVIRCCE